MNVVTALRSDRAAPSRGTPPGRSIVVAREQVDVVCSIEDTLDRLEERAGAAAMEIASRGTGIRHEQRVARENGVADDEAKMINGVTRRGERLDREVAEREMFAYSDATGRVIQ